jgi:hypothetical protein
MARWRAVGVPFLAVRFPGQMPPFSWRRTFGGRVGKSADLLIPQHPHAPDQEPRAAEVDLSAVPLRDVRERYSVLEIHESWLT